jgi:hypothetical protein
VTSDAERQRRYRERRRAQGWRQVHGTWTKAPHRNHLANQEPPHGTPNRYRWKQDPCRCRACLDAINEYNRTYRQKRKANQ